jgi:hypothetical protein
MDTRVVRPESAAEVAEAAKEEAALEVRLP